MRLKLFADRVGYSFKAINANYIENELAGGRNDRRLDLYSPNYIVDCTFTLNPVKYRYFVKFYNDYMLDPKPFNMYLYIHPSSKQFPLSNCLVHFVKDSVSLQSLKGHTIKVKCQLEVCVDETLNYVSGLYPVTHKDSSSISNSIGNFAFSGSPMISEATSIAAPTLSAFEIKSIVQTLTVSPVESTLLANPVLSGFEVKALLNEATIPTESTLLSNPVLSGFEIKAIVINYNNYPAEATSLTNSIGSFTLS